MNYDLAIKNGFVLDGTGKTAFKADVLVKDNRIIDVGLFSEAKSFMELNVEGLTVSPGFIDVHTHLDFVLADSICSQILEKWVRQGVTTIVAGNCGFSPAPVTPETAEFLSTYWSCALPKNGLNFAWNYMEQFLDVLRKKGQVLNVAMLTGHSTLRHNEMGCKARFAGKDNIRAMQKSLEKSLSAGSIGLSVGLYYVPGTYSHTNEISSLASVLSESQKPLVAHTRGLSQTYDLAVGEMIEIAEQNHIALQLSHHAGGHSIPKKLMTVYGPGTRTVLFALCCLGKWMFKLIFNSLNQVRKRTNDAVNRARQRGVLIGCDNMPWFCGPTGILALLPPWLFDEGIENALERLKSPEIRKQVEYEIRSIIPKWPNWEHKYWTDNFLSLSAHISGFSRTDNQILDNMPLKKISKMRRMDSFTTFFDIVEEEKGRLFIMDGLFDNPAGDIIIEEYLMDPFCSIMTDVIGAAYQTPNPVPYGAFAKVLGYFARDRNLMTQAEAVRRMTSLPAQQMGLKNRGILQKGAYADICIFDSENIRHIATFKNPNRFSQGVEYVIVNGKIILDKGKYLPESMAGQVLST